MTVADVMRVCSVVGFTYLGAQVYSVEKSQLFQRVFALA